MAHEREKPVKQPAIRFGVIGVNHNHIGSIIAGLLAAGAEFASFHAPEPELAGPFAARYTDAQVATSAQEVLEDPAIQLIVTSGILCDRAGVGMAAMRHGKDFLTDKPGFTTLEQLANVRQVQRQTNRIYCTVFGRLSNPSILRAGELIRAGAIGQVVHVMGMGPHRAGLANRPDWFFQRAKYGGIITDIGSHQCDQFLFYTGAKTADVVAAQVANYKWPQHPELEEIGEVMLRSDSASGFFQVNWYTPDGLAAHGDIRDLIIGTDGYIEIRRNIDIAGLPGSNHLLLVDHEGVRRIGCGDVELTFYRDLLSDIRNRTETAVTQAHCFAASEIFLRAQAQAVRLGNLR